MPSADNKRIAKNTLLLYIRKIIGIVIAFYSSRLLLQALGIDDFGLYGLIGSIVALFSSLRGLFSSAIQRFINIAKGKAEVGMENMIFCLGVKIHIYISIIFFVIVEIAGIILIPKLNIAPDLIPTAQWVLQFSILASIVTIMTVPYDALIIANERFNAYALFAIIESILRLGIIFLLFFSDANRIIFYSALIFAVSLLVRIMNMVYCKRNFGEVAKYHNVTNKDLFTNMTQFAWWQFFGSTGYAISTSGLNFILNIFGGTIANAARAIAYQVMNVVMQFMNDVNISFQPRAMIKFAENDYLGFQKLLFLCTKTTFSICSLLVFPIIFFTPTILKIWLTDVPEYAVVFIRLIMVYTIIRSLHCTFDILFKTTNKLKEYQICEFIILTLEIPLGWILLKYGYPLYTVFVSVCVLEIINLCIITIIAKYRLSFDIKEYFRDIILRTLICLFIISIVGYIIHLNWFDSESIISLILCGTIYVGVSLAVILLVLFTKNEFYQFIRLFNKNN